MGHADTPPGGKIAGDDPFGLTPAAWASLRELLDQALDLPEAERGAWVERLAPPHAAFKTRLNALLAHAHAPLAGALLNTLPKVGTDRNPPRGAAAPDTGRVGPYRLLRQLGEGGMATVWLAERTDLLQGRRVALKLPHGAWRRAGLAERMAREREILATLDHPNIARLYDAGLADDGQPYMALETIDGEPLWEHCNRLALGVDARLRLFLQVLGAVAHAHTRLVVHRDLKPSNILVDAAGQAKLLDFGIARLIDAGAAPVPATALTQQAGRALTPDYASPEQVAGRPIGTASDVYSLGVLLYEGLTGQRPYRLQRGSAAALEEAILQAAPNRPSAVAAPAWRRRLRGDLDTIVLKAMAKEPTARYASAQALADDIERHLGGHPVWARPASRWYRAARFVVRNRVGVGLATAMAAVLLAGAGVAIWQAGLARAEQLRAEEVKDFVVAVIRDADPAAGRGKPLEAAELLRRARARIDQIDPGRAELRTELLNVTGEALLGLGDPHTAEAVLRQAEGEASRRLAPGHALALHARLLLVEALLERDAAPGMRELLTPLVPLLRARAAADPAMLVRALGLVAKMEIAAAHGPQAVQAAQEAFDLARSRLGEHSPGSVAASTILAEAQEYLRPGPADSLAAAERGLRYAEAAHSADPAHPQVVRMREIHAMALADAGHDEPAVAQWQRALDDALLAYGPGSVAEGLMRGNMVPALRRLGLIHEALASAERSEALLAGRLRDDSRTRALHLLYRATAWAAARRGAEALADFARAHQIIARLQGPVSLEALDARMGRGVAQASLGHFAQAEADLSAVAEAARRDFPDTLHLVTSMHSVALRLQGHAEAAVAAQREAIATMPRNSLADTYLMRRLPELGLAQLDTGDPQGALTSLQQALTLLERRQQAPTPARAEVWLGIGRAHLATGRAAQALDWLERADGYWQRFDAHNRGAGEAAHWLARGHQALGHRAPARAADERARATLARSPLPVDAALLAGAQRAGTPVTWRR